MNIISVSIAFNFERKNCNFSKANTYLWHTLPKGNQKHIQNINKQIASGNEHFKYLICPLNRAYTVLQ